MQTLVFIEKNVPSSKNSRVNGKWFSKTVVQYLKHHGIKSFSSRKKTVEGYKTRPITFPVQELKELFKDVEYPVEIGFLLLRDSKRKFDFNNVNQLIMDLLTAFDIIPDDSTEYVVARCLYHDTQGKRQFYIYDKYNPGVYLKIIPYEKITEGIL